jgi:hypothetical protein
LKMRWLLCGPVAKAAAQPTPMDKLHADWDI